ncbi:MAG: ABC transporter substrate-binding protein [Candidatus Improbicoccus pseudotrichonymphae]|uniref:ABC transporter substrate-binding protein n=1 Tax=Candidatus Improbicoccus pseudotrichonymphae TaxID=3033792 RepID=A0AA48KVT3_9FIRM|nr:MAG: ABC transporter substrate-binding protein [Candidatus Improbicoccus pseudotrichonymphae]
MKKNSKIWCLVLLAVLVFSGLSVFLPSLLHNSKKRNDEGEKIFKIGILQFAEHESLDDCREGFINGLNNLGLKNGEQVEIDYKNAQGDSANCVAIAKRFVDDKKDLIFTISTQATITAAKITKKIPILFSAVTYPVGSNLVVSNSKPETNVSGTTDLSPIDKQIDLIKKLLPSSKNIAILYSSGEPNSKYQADIAVEEAKKIGLDSRVYTFSHFSELQVLVLQMKGKVDAIYVPTDNQVASNFGVVLESAEKIGVPVFTWDEGSVRRGGTASLAMNYTELGVLTAGQAYEILVNKKNVSEMPVESLKNAKLVLNRTMVEKFKIDVSYFDGKYQLVENLARNNID